MLSLCLLATAALVGLAAGQVGPVPVTILNPGLEENAYLTVGGWGEGIPAWSVFFFLSPSVLPS